MQDLIDCIQFTDPDFDIESDLAQKNCLEGLMSSYDDPLPPKSNVSPGRLGEALATLAESNLLASPSMVIGLHAAAKLLEVEESSENSPPGSVHRIDYVFDAPSFTVNGFSSSDVKQGSNGDCWFIAAVATLCSNPRLMEKVCVAADKRCQECGVYGFVFYRDGEWIWTVVDDNLYVRYQDFDAYGDDYDPTGAKERKYKKNNQTGSGKLIFMFQVNSGLIKQMLSISHHALTRMRHGYHCWKRHLPRFTETTMRLPVA